jgi:endonuclease I
MKKATFLLLCIFIAIFTHIFAQIPSGYYNNVNGKKGKELQIALNQIVNDHRNVSYTDVWFYYQFTDLKTTGKIWDIYSDIPQGTPPYEFEFRKHQCINIGNQEGICYTREHSFCQSWFGGGQAAPYTDIFHLYPVDGLINSVRNNNAYGKVTTATRIFLNGSKMGINTYPGAPNKPCYEPLDEYKGDLARSFFYMATRYMFEDENFQDNIDIAPMTLKSQLRPWALNMLLEWHEMDPVSQKEIDRNNAIYAVQKNRNPFIDHPNWVYKIWGSDSVNPVQISPASPPEKPKIKWFALTDSRTLKMTFTLPMVTWTIENPLNYYVGETVTITSLHANNDTLELHLGGLFSQNVTYNLSVKHLLATNMAFINDTTVSFLYPYKIEQEPLLAWTFDNLPAAPNTPKRISADYHLLDTVSEAILFCDGAYQSSDFISISGNTNQLTSYNGTTIGDPRPNFKAGNAIAFANTSANGKSAVFKFPTKGYFNLSLSMAVRRTSTGFNTHQWEWSMDGEDYTLLENATTCPLTAGEFVITNLDLRDIDELNDQYEVFLRLTLNGATGPTGNNRIDNITLHGVSIYSNSIKDFKKKDSRFIIAPNPNQGQFQIIYSHSNDYFNADYVIYNSFGQKIKAGNLTGSLIDISEQPNGVYFLKIDDEIIKIIKSEL